MTAPVATAWPWWTRRHAAGERKIHVDHWRPRHPEAAWMIQHGYAQHVECRRMIQHGYPPPVQSRRMIQRGYSPRVHRRRSHQCTQGWPMLWRAMRQPQRCPCSRDTVQTWPAVPGYPDAFVFPLSGPLLIAMCAWHRPGMGRTSLHLSPTPPKRAMCTASGAAPRKAHLKKNSECKQPDVGGKRSRPRMHRSGTYDCRMGFPAHSVPHEPMPLSSEMPRHGRRSFPPRPPAQIRLRRNCSIRIAASWTRQASKKNCTWGPPTVTPLRADAAQLRAHSGNRPHNRWIRPRTTAVRFARNPVQVISSGGQASTLRRPPDCAHAAKQFCAIEIPCALGDRVL